MATKSDELFLEEENILGEVARSLGNKTVNITVENNRSSYRSGSYKVLTEKLNEIDPEFLGRYSKS